MKLLYIIGPYRGTATSTRDQNIKAAEEQSLWWVDTQRFWDARDNYFPVTPHLVTARFDNKLPDVPEEYWLEGTMELLRRCDAVYVMPRWRESAGSRAEIKEALRLGKEFFGPVTTEEASREVK